MRIPALFITALLALSGCETTPSPAPAPGQSPARDLSNDMVIWQPAPNPQIYAALPGWAAADLAPGLNALRRSCAVFDERPADGLLSARAPWAGTATDWQPACAALDVIGDESSARAVIEALFTPVEVVDPAGEARFTGYFEPTYPARMAPTPPYTEPVPARPADLVLVDGAPYQKLANGAVRPYPERAEITRTGVQPLAYAHPADVFFLQIQGSGRLVLEDGRTLRAAYAANNGHPFRSTANWLMARGWISRGEASMTGIRAWMDRASPQQVRQAMNANPRFVFFDLQPEGDPTFGPRGSLGVPLTPLGSMAVDTSLHPAGIPMFIQTDAPGLGGAWSGLLVAQDTGGAIKGPVRGDIFFGTGPDAGSAADTVNAPGRLWVLLPRGLAERIRVSRETADNKTIGLRAVAP